MRPVPADDNRRQAFPDSPLAGDVPTPSRPARRFSFVLMLGDNLYHDDYQGEFSVPYQGLLERGVLFYASLGNHDRELQLPASGHVGCAPLRHEPCTPPSDGASRSTRSSRIPIRAGQGGCESSSSACSGPAQPWTGPGTTAIVKELIATFEIDWAQTGISREREDERDEAVEAGALAAAALAPA